MLAASTSIETRREVPRSIIRIRVKAKGKGQGGSARSREVQDGGKWELDI